MDTASCILPVKYSFDCTDFRETRSYWRAICEEGRALCLIFYKSSNKFVYYGQKLIYSLHCCWVVIE